MIPSDPNEPRLLTWMRNPRVRRTLTLAFLWCFVVWIIARVGVVLLPFGLALLLSFIVDPAVSRLSQLVVGGRPIGRAVALIALYIVVITLAVFLGGWGLTQITRELSGIGGVSRNLLNELQQMATSALDWADRFAADNQIPIDRAAMEEAIRQNLTNASETITGHATGLLSVGRNVVGGAFRAIFGLFLVLMLTAFISIDRDRILRFFFTLVPPEYQAAYSTVVRGAGEGLAGVVRGQLLICFTNGVLTFIGLSLLGIKLPLILATIAAVFSVIPIFGSILSTIPLVAMGLTDSFTKGLLALLWVIAIHLVEANFLNPRIMGSAARIHPVIVVFVLVVGEHYGGLIGALFAVPIAAVVLTVFKFMHKRALEAPGLTTDLSIQKEQVS